MRLLLTKYANTTDYNNRPSNDISFMPPIPSTSYIVNLCDFYFYRLVGKLTAFLQLQELSLRNLPLDCSTSAARRSPRTSKQKLATSSLRLQLYVRITLNFDGTPTASRSHTHPSHSQTSRLLTSSLSLGGPVPRVTQCMRGV
jgi:hypothetical protein